MCTSRPLVAQRGLTMVELVMFIVIVSVAVVGVMQVLSLTARTSADPLLRKQALAIAESLLEEVEMARFTFCDPSDPTAETATTPAACVVPEAVGQEAGTAGRPFDNVNDYVGAFNVAQSVFLNNAGALSDASLTAMPVTGYTATLRLIPEALNGIASNATAAGMNVLRISVTVSYGSESLVLEGYRTRYAPNAVP